MTIASFKHFFKQNEERSLAALALRKKTALFDSEKQVLCHRDLLLENIMVLNKYGNGMQLIDFEYAGFCNMLWDAASFILEAGITGKTHDAFIKACRLDAPADKLRLTEMEIAVDYIWVLWGVVNRYREYAKYASRAAWKDL